MWQLLLPLALWPGVMGLGRDELTAAQHLGLQVALEEFHKHPPVQWTFRETSVDSAMDTVSGTPGRGGGWSARSQGGGTKALGPRRRPALQRRASQPSHLLGRAVSRWRGGRRDRSRPGRALPAQLTAGLPPSVGSPSRPGPL